MTENVKDIAWKENEKIIIDAIIIETEIVVNAKDHEARKFVNDHEAEVGSAKNANDDDLSEFTLNCYRCD